MNRAWTIGALLIAVVVAIGALAGYAVFSSLVNEEPDALLVGVVEIQPTPSPTPRPTPAPTPAPTPSPRRASRDGGSGSGATTGERRSCPENCQCGTTPGGGVFIRCSRTVRSPDEIN